LLGNKSEGRWDWNTASAILISGMPGQSYPVPLSYLYSLPLKFRDRKK